MGRATLSLRPVHETNADCALAFTQLGWYTLALPPRSKDPYSGSHGINDSTTDFDQLVPVFEREPLSNIAIDPAKSGILIGDWDYRNNGSDLLGFVIARHGPKILDTVTVIKDGGPHHYWLTRSSYPAHNFRLPRKSPIDFIGSAPFATRKYVVVPPSIHPDGCSYEWAPGRSPWEHTVKPFPVEILPTLEEYFRHKTRAKATPDFEMERRRAALLTDSDSAGTLHYEYDGNSHFLRLFCELLGIPYKDSIAYGFPSPIRKDIHSSAALYMCRQGYYRYHDFGDVDANGTNVDCSLVQLYGAWATGRDTPLPKLNSVTYAVWHTRMRLELSVTSCPVLVRVDLLAADASDLIVKVWEGFRLLLQCRATHYGEVRPVPYTYDFAASWCGLSRSDAEVAIRWLKAKGYLITVGTDTNFSARPTSLYLPLCYAPPITGSAP